MTKKAVEIWVPLEEARLFQRLDVIEPNPRTGGYRLTKFGVKMLVEGIELSKKVGTRPMKEGAQEKLESEASQV